MNYNRLSLLIIAITGIFSYTSAQLSDRFERKIMDNEPLDQIWAKGKGDFNGDGHIDFMIAGRGSVIWYENPVGSGNTEWIKHIAYSGPDVGFEGCATGDINDNGHIDIVIGAYHIHMLYVLENPGHGKGEWKIHALGGPKTDVTYLYDLDGDG